METPNNEQIISRLLGEQQAPTQQVVAADDSQVMITTSRVVGIRYRVYFLIALVAVVVFGNYILLPARDTFQTTRAESQTIALQVSTFATKKMQMDADKALITKMEAQQNLIVSCLNDRKSCTDIDAAIKNNFWFARSYIQLNNLTDPKMVINEKVLLTNINEYLLKENNGSTNGNISKIAIGEPKQYAGNLRYAPLKLSITFDNKDSLLSFLSNVETRILPDPAFRVLYKIDKVSYDVANYTAQQSVDIDLNAYYYTN
jgi:hypothetical protein